MTYCIIYDFKPSDCNEFQDEVPNLRTPYQSAQAVLNIVFFTIKQVCTDYTFDDGFHS